MKALTAVESALALSTHPSITAVMRETIWQVCDEHDDLLAALRAFEHAFNGKTIEAHGLADTMNIGYAIEKAKAAIAKAEGKS